MDQQEAISLLGLEDASAEVQQKYTDLLAYRLGETLDANLTDEERHEYQSIIDGDSAFIASWLESNLPNYKESTAYRELSLPNNTPDDEVPADKVIASLAWTKRHFPNLQETVERIAAELRTEIAV